MPDDTRISILEAMTPPTLAQRKTRIVTSWVRFAKTICRGDAAFVLDTAGGRPRIIFIDGQSDFLEAADQIAATLSRNDAFVVTEVFPSTARGRERSALIGVRVSSDKALCIVVDASRVAQIEDRRIAALCSIAKLCGSVLAFSPPRSDDRKFGSPRASRGGRFATVQSGKHFAY